MPVQSDFTSRFIIDWVYRKLGFPTIAVEVEEPAVLDAIDDTLELFQKYRPKVYEDPRVLTKGRYKLDPPDNTVGLLDVDFMRNDVGTDYQSLEGSLLYDPFYFLSAGGLTGVDVQTYDMTRHWIEIMAREFGAEEGFYELEDYSVLIQIPGNFKVTLFWAMPYDSLADVPRAYQQLFLNLVLAKVRQILGFIRSKYASVPGAGGSVQMDGEYLRERGYQDEEKYTQELMRISPHYVPSMG